jgi:hypothetical protein
MATGANPYGRAKVTSQWRSFGPAKNAEPQDDNARNNPTFDTHRAAIVVVQRDRRTWKTSICDPIRQHNALISESRGST